MRGIGYAREIELKESKIPRKKRKSFKGRCPEKKNEKNNSFTTHLEPLNHHPAFDSPKDCEFHCISSKPKNAHSSILLSAPNNIKNNQQKNSKSQHSLRRTSQKRGTNKQKIRPPRSERDELHTPAADPNDLGTIKYLDEGTLTSPVCSPKRHHSQPNGEGRRLRKFKYYSQPGEETPSIYRQLISQKKPPQSKNRSKSGRRKPVVKKSFPLLYFSKKLTSSNIFPISKKNPRPFPCTNPSIKDFPAVFSETLHKRCVPKIKANMWNILVLHDFDDETEYDTQNRTNTNEADSLWGRSSLIEETCSPAIIQCQYSKNNLENSQYIDTHISKCENMHSVYSACDGEYKRHSEEIEKCIENPQPGFSSREFKFEKCKNMEIRSVSLRVDLPNEVNPEPENSIWKPTMSPETTP